MRTVSIGAGNLSTHFSKALQDAGFEIVQVFSRTETSAKELARKLSVPYTTHVSHIVDDASLYIISVSDDAIELLSERLAQVSGLVAHTSGSVPMDVFAGKITDYGVLYPLQTFSKSRPVEFSEIPIFIEANTQDNLQILHQVADAVSRKVYHASSVERRQLHLAAVFGCNFVNHLYHLSVQIAHQAGFDFSVLSPLILETAHKALVTDNPVEVQTGPAVRNDEKVMRQHLEMLSSRPEWKEIYAILSENIRKVMHESSVK